MPKLRKITMTIGGEEAGTWTLPCTGRFPPLAGLSGTLTAVLAWTPPEVAVAASPGFALDVMSLEWGTDPALITQAFTPNALTDLGGGDPFPTESVATVFVLLGYTKFTTYTFNFDVTCSLSPGCIVLLRAAGAIAADGSSSLTLYPRLTLGTSTIYGDKRLTITCDSTVPLATFALVRPTITIPLEGEFALAGDVPQSVTRADVMGEIEDRIALRLQPAIDVAITELASVLLERVVRTRPGDIIRDVDDELPPPESG